MIIRIKGKYYKVLLKERELVNVNNERDRRKILSNDEFDYFYYMFNVEERQKIMNN